MEYLLLQGADPLAVDLNYSRSCLHHAAANGHVDCLRVLCRDSTVVDIDGSKRPLKDCIVTDIQIKSARFIDQRSYGGLTPLHFAVVSGNVEAVRVLLQAGAASMVRSDGEADVGEERLAQGSTPLHVAVLVGSLPIIHSLLAAHAELMNIAGQGITDRGRRPWEGHSRTDIRSVRSSVRKLPYHLARDRGWTQIMHLVDPRIPVDNALDAIRDTEHGIGPKRLSTICSQVLQESLMQWLDKCDAEKQEESANKLAAQPAALPPQPTKLSVAGSISKQQSAALQRATAGQSMQPSVEFLHEVHVHVETNAITAAASTPVARPSSPAVSAAARPTSCHAPSCSAPATLTSPFAFVASASVPATPENHHSRLLAEAAAAAKAHQQPIPASAPAVPTLDISRDGSLRAYVGMLSEKHPLPRTSGAGETWEIWTGAVPVDPHHLSNGLVRRGSISRRSVGPADDSSTTAATNRAALMSRVGSYGSSSWARFGGSPTGGAGVGDGTSPACTAQLTVTQPPIQVYIAVPCIVYISSCLHVSPCTISNWFTHIYFIFNINKYFI